MYRVQTFLLRKKLSFRKKSKKTEDKKVISLKFLRFRFFSTSGKKTFPLKLLSNAPIGFTADSLQNSFGRKTSGQQTFGQYKIG
jgi:hypothetical protein